MQKLIGFACAALASLSLRGIAPGVPMGAIFRGIWPFWFAMLAAIILVLIFPNLALHLPSTMFGY